MARPGPSYKIANSFNVIAHDKHGVPDSPLFGVSPRRQADYRPRMEEDIETIRDREIKLVRGIIKPDYRVKTDNHSSYDLISGIQTRRPESDRDFHGFREREMDMAARTGRQGYNPTTTTPVPGTPIRADNHVPFSPLYRPPGQGQGHGLMGEEQRPEGQGQDFSPVDGARPGPTVEQERPQSFGRDAYPQPPTPHHPPQDWAPHDNNHNVDNNDHQYPDPRPSQHTPMMADTRGKAPWSPIYQPGQGRGLAMADPRTGSPVKGKVMWQDAKATRPTFPPTPDFNTTKLNLGQNDDVRTKFRPHDVRDSRDDFRVLEEFRDHRGNVVIKGFPPNSYRSGYGLSSDRGLAKASEGNSHGDVADPRQGGNVFIGPGLMGTRNGGAFFLIKFDAGKGNLQVAGHAFLRAKTHDCGGRYLGMARRVYEFGYEQGPEDAVAVFHFPSMEKALLFFQTDAVLRQPDFPPPYGHAEMWIVCNAYLPDNMRLFDTFLLSEVQLHAGKDRREFFETFQVPFENYLYKNGAMPFVVCSYGSRDRQDVRRHCYPHNAVVTCHLFQGLEHLNWVTNDETYSKYRSLHNQMATEKCYIFKLSKDTGL